MTIAERKAREEHDRENPWKAMDRLPPVGLIVNLMFDDMVGHHSPDGMQYFLDVDRNWYHADSGVMVWNPPMNWRPAWVIIRAERRSVLKARSKVT
jgi:hypothetical protein